MSGEHRRCVDTAAVGDYGSDGWGWPGACGQAAGGYDGEDAELAAADVHEQRMSR